MEAGIGGVYWKTGWRQGLVLVRIDFEGELHRDGERKGEEEKKKGINVQYNEQTVASGFDGITVSEYEKMKGNSGTHSNDDKEFINVTRQRNDVQAGLNYLENV